MKITLEKAKELAMENYEKGGDVFVECYEDSELEELIKDMNTGDFRKEIAIRDDMNKDRAGYAW